MPFSYYPAPPPGFTKFPKTMIFAKFFTKIHIYGQLITAMCTNVLLLRKLFYVLFYFFMFWFTGKRSYRENQAVFRTGFFDIWRGGNLSCKILEFASYGGALLILGGQCQMTITCRRSDPVETLFCAWIILSHIFRLFVGPTDLWEVGPIDLLPFVRSLPAFLGN